MSVKRLFHWKCDLCGLEVLKESYGFPAKWSYEPKTLKNKALIHKCEDCNKKQKGK